MNRKTRRDRERTFPKCPCGATLGLRIQEDGMTVCSRCAELLEKIKDQVWVREQRLAKAGES